MENDRLNQPTPLPYAHPRTPTGPADYDIHARPSDFAGFWNPASFKDDGTVFRLEPGSRFRSFLLSSFTVCFFSVVPAIQIATRVPRISGLEVTMRISACVLTLFAAFVAPGFFIGWRRDRTPWILVDRHEKRVTLPR